LKKTLKIIGKILLGFIVFVLLYLLVAFILSRITVNEEANSKDEVTIHIITNGVHTDIVMPAKNDQKDWTKEIKYTNTISNDSTNTYLAMGWGDKGFYLETPTWAELKPSVAFNAATGFNTTAIHATYYDKMVVSDSCKKIEISKEQYNRLINYITDSFQTNTDGHFINIETDANYGKTDAFYEAKGRYSMLRTCNSWANQGLKISGQKGCLWTAFDTGIFLKY
jgi:uncharacterized protein (TIGR02117 family)